MNNENTLPVPNTVIEELRGAELIAWIMAEKFYIFSYEMGTRNTLPLSTTFESWYEGFGFTQRGHKEIIDAFKSLEEKGFIYNNELRCHTKKGEWTDFDGNDQYSFGVGGTGENVEMRDFGYFAPINNEIIFSSKLSLKDKVVLTDLLYRWGYAKTHKSFDCSFREIGYKFNIKDVKDVMEKLMKKNFLYYRCSEGGNRELVELDIYFDNLGIKERNTRVKRHYKKSDKPRKAYTKKSEVKMEDIFMECTMEELLEAMEEEEIKEKSEIEDIIEEVVNEVEEEKYIPVEVNKDTTLTKSQAQYITGQRGMHKTLKAALLLELTTLPEVFRDKVTVWTLFNNAKKNHHLTPELIKMGECFFERVKYEGEPDIVLKGPKIINNGKEKNYLKITEGLEMLKDDYVNNIRKEQLEEEENKEFVAANDCPNFDEDDYNSMDSILERNERMQIAAYTRIRRAM